MARNLGEWPGLNLLSLDGGGITGLSSLYILREIMNRLQGNTGQQRRPDPYEYFDLIAGTGTGAISAVMLGRLRMSIDDTIRQYIRLASDIFCEQNAIRGSGMSNEARLEEGLRNIVQETTGNADEMMMEEKPQQAKCKVVIYAMSAHNMNASLPCAFRTYPASANAMPDCPIWKALRASTAHPELFKSAEIEELGIKLQFIGGAFGCSNPTAQMLKEASTLFPDRFVASVTSIGTGHARTIQIPQPSRPGRALPLGAVLKVAQAIATDNERVAEEMAARFSNTEGVYYRLNVNQGIQDIRACEWEKQSEVASHAGSYLQLAEVNRRLNRLVLAVQGRRATLAARLIDGHIHTVIQSRPAVDVSLLIDKRTAFPSSPITIGLKYCPRATLMFKGRKLQLEKASKYFGNEEEQHVFVLYGLGGAGKTQTALKCAELMVVRFEGILFIDGSSPDTIETALTRFAVSNNIGKEYTNTLRWLESRKGRWLMLFDNMDDPNVRVQNYFPCRNKYDIMITTRHQAVVSLARGKGSKCEIDKMDPEEALELLLEAASLRNDAIDPTENEAATSLLQEFGYLALAIVQCGAFICQTRCSIAQYYKMYLAERQATLEGSKVASLKIGDYRHSIYTTWTLNHKLVGTSVEKLWHLMAFLDRDGISEEIFRRAYQHATTYQSQIPPSDSEAEAQRNVLDVLKLFASDKGDWSSRLFVSAMGELLCSSLIRLDIVKNIYQLHPLVQQWARTTAPKSAIANTSFLLALSINHKRPGEDHAFRRGMVSHVNEILDLRAMPTSNNAWQFMAVYQAIGNVDREEPLGLFVMESRMQELGGEHPDTLESIRVVACIHRERGRLKQAEEMHVQVLAARKRVLGEDHPDTLRSMTDLANTYGNQDRVAEAEALQVEVLAARKRVLGEDHPDTMRSTASLANTYKFQGRLAIAKLLLVKVLADQKQVLGEDHPDTMFTMASLAVTFRYQGRLAEAEALQVEVLAAQKRVLGEDHPDTMNTMSSLATTYIARGRLAEAEVLQVKVLAARERVLGEDHPVTMMNMASLATTYIARGRLAEAEALQVEVLAARKRVLGEDHPDTMRSTTSLANTYKNQGRLATAELLLVKVLADQKQVLGEDHPGTMLTMASLAVTFRDQGRLAEAEALQVEVLAARKRVLGEDHPDTMFSMTILAIMYKFQGRLAVAESMEVKVLAARKRLLGKDHPDTMMSMASLAVTFMDQGRLAEAESLQVEVLADQKRLLGEDHPDTMKTMSNLAITYIARGRLAEAEVLQVKVLVARKRVLGEDHPDTMFSMTILAITYKIQGRLVIAESMEVKVLAVRKRVLGKDHRDTMMSMASLAVTFRDQGRLAEAESLQVEVLADQKRVLGENHPDTMKTMSNLAITYKDQGRRAVAESMEVKVLAARKRVLGEDHPDTMMSMASLAITFRDQGRLAEAEALQVEVLAAQKRVLGEDHPDTMKTMSNLAIMYKFQGRLAEAEALQVEVLAARKRVLGEDHPDTMRSMESLATTYIDQGRLAIAKLLLVILLAARSRVLGEAHPDTLWSMRALTRIFGAQAPIRPLRCTRG